MKCVRRMISKSVFLSFVKCALLRGETEQVLYLVCIFDGSCWLCQLQGTVSCIEVNLQQNLIHPSFLVSILQVTVLQQFDCLVEHKKSELYNNSQKINGEGQKRPEGTRVLKLNVLPLYIYLLLYLLAFFCRNHFQPSKEKINATSEIRPLGLLSVTFHTDALYCSLQNRIRDFDKRCTQSSCHKTAVCRPRVNRVTNQASLLLK